MRVPAHRALLATVSAVAATIFVSGAAAASLTPAAGTARAAPPAAGSGGPAMLRVRARPEHGQGRRHLLPVLHRRPGRDDRQRQHPDPDLDDLRHWTYTGTVFADKPAWITAALGNIPNLWAPDISYFGGLWHLYYAGSSFGSNNSVIGLATTPTLDPAQPALPLDRRRPGLPSSTADDYNAIDPSLVSTPPGPSGWSSGRTGAGSSCSSSTRRPGSRPVRLPTIYSLAQRPAPDAVEGAGITYHDGYYYLFVSFDHAAPA